MSTNDPAPSETWVFGYGSLIWRADFAYSARADARVEGWARRFWQGSPDHRGTPDAPGRVVTLIEDPDAVLWGRVYRIGPAARAHLDHREQAGYAHHRVTATLRDGTSLRGVRLYVAGPSNPWFLGPAPRETMVSEIVSRSGLSGENLEYLLKLADALDGMGVYDPAVHPLAGSARGSRR